MSHPPPIGVSNAEFQVLHGSLSFRQRLLYVPFAVFLSMIECALWLGIVFGGTVCFVVSRLNLPFLGFDVFGVWLLSTFIFGGWFWSMYYIFSWQINFTTWFLHGFFIVVVTIVTEDIIGIPLNLLVSSPIYILLGIIFPLGIIWSPVVIIWLMLHGELNRLACEPISEDELVHNDLTLSDTVVTLRRLWFDFSSGECDRTQRDRWLMWSTFWLFVLLLPVFSPFFLFELILKALAPRVTPISNSFLNLHLSGLRRIQSR